MSVQVANDLIEICNQQFPDQPVMPVMIACLTLQTIVVSGIVDVYEPGTPEGLKAIRDLYASALKDAEDRWNGDKLKKDVQRMREMGILKPRPST